MAVRGPDGAFFLCLPVFSRESNLSEGKEYSKMREQLNTV